MNEENKLCTFCDNIYKYICSTCQRPYCSLNCYRSNSHMDCSELFYKNQVMEVLKNDNVRPDDKKNMIEILKRVEEYQADEDSDDDIVKNDEMLHESVKSLNLDDNIDEDTLWGCLTEKGRQEFKRNLKMGTAESFIELWHPWWFKTEKRVQEIDGPSCSASVNSPPIDTRIANFCDLISKPPPDCLKYNVINILYAYVFVAYHYNGDHLELPEEASNFFLNLCNVFSLKKNYESAEEAIIAVINILNEESCWKIERKEAAYFIDDVIAILSGPSSAKPLHFVLSALSDLKTLFIHARHAQKKSSNKTQCFQAIKKLDFYLSWTKDFGKNLKPCITFLEMEKLTILEDINKFSIENKCVKRKKKLIEELD